MVETNHNTKDNHIRCVKCSKLLAKGAPFGDFEIKCVRCGTLNVVFEQVTDQVVLTDPEGVILYINKAAEKITGFTSEEAVGKKPSALWGNNMPKEFYRDMWKAIKEEKRPFQTVLTNKNKNGEMYKIKLVVSPILDSQGTILFYVGTETK